MVRFAEPHALQNAGGIFRVRLNAGQLDHLKAVKLPQNLIVKPDGLDAPAAVGQQYAFAKRRQLCGELVHGTLAEDQLCRCAIGEIFHGADILSLYFSKE